MMIESPFARLKLFRQYPILSQEEVAQLIDAAPTAFYRTVLMTLYATGVRNAELTRLKISDVDSQRMVLHVQGGKGRQDRDVMLSPVLLEELRAHWRRLCKRSSVWIVQKTFQAAASMAVRFCCFVICFLF